MLMIKKIGIELKESWTFLLIFSVFSFFLQEKFYFERQIVRKMKNIFSYSLIRTESCRSKSTKSAT